MQARQLLSLLSLLFLAACATAPGGSAETPVAAGGACPVPLACPACPVCPTPPPPPPPAAKPLQPAQWEEVKGWANDNLAETYAAFMESCKALARQALWRAVCEDSGQLNNPDSAALRAFFEARFKPWTLVNPDGNREGLVTGYYEPLLKGSRQRKKPRLYPIYAVPDDLLVIDFGDLYPELKPMRLRGRLEGRKVVPYWSRAELTQQERKSAGSFADKALLWVEDPIELFFLQVQGSGRVELPDGSRVRVGYAEQNGHPYQSIGRWLVERGELKLEQASMQGIQAWAKANPKRVDELLNLNPSYVFFRELPDTGGGPIGALGVPLTPTRSIAVDARTVPLGAPVFISTTQPNSDKPLQRLVMAQDTGGAIKGVVRADFFWGFGVDAGAQAGRMRQKAEMWLIMPKEYAPK